MHRLHPASAGQGSAEACALRGTSDPLGAVIASILGSAAVLPNTASSFVPALTAVAAAPVAHDVLDVSFVPDSPPPRG